VGKYSGEGISFLHVFVFVCCNFESKHWGSLEKAALRSQK